MNATSLSELRNAGGPRGPADEKLEQVRELLLGETVRRLEARLSALETHMREVDQTVTRQLSVVATRIETMAAETGAERRTAFDDLARSVMDLGERISRISRP